MLRTDTQDLPTAGGNRLDQPLDSLRNSYARLPEHFYARLAPTPVARPTLVQFNDALAMELGHSVTGANADALTAVLSGNAVPPGAEPIAMAYAGHQFGSFVAQLGDGRAILLGELKDRSGHWRELQLKGSGQTPYSRNGDGRAALGPVLREYLVSESMHALGIPTTRALAVVASGERVRREQLLPGAVLTRVARSHVRVGTFEYFAARGDTVAMRALAEYVIDRLYPEVRGQANPYLGLLAAVADRQADLVARWMHVGFIHGVMNTDNMAISGETIDFGPCAFMDTYDAATVFSSIDAHGRYAYANQPHAAHWNVARFAETLLPLLDPLTERAIELATDVIAAFPARYRTFWQQGMRAKLGLAGAEADDPALIQSLLDLMQQQRADYTLTFRRLCAAIIPEGDEGGVREQFADPAAFDAWAASWRARLERDPMAPPVRAEAMRCVNPAYIPRNHLVERALVAAVEHEDFAPCAQLREALSRPYMAREGFAAYALPPLPGEQVLQTFCGT